MKSMVIKLISIFLFLFSIQAGAQQKDKGREYLYAGTFSERGSEGIYVFAFSASGGELQLIQTVPGKESPSFLAIDEKKSHLYAVYREGVDKDDKNGTVVAYVINQEDGRLARINEQSTQGQDACHISVDPKGDYVYISHYGNGSFVIVPIVKNGSLAPASDVVQLTGQSVVLPRQSHPRTHSALPSNNGKFIYVADLGIDKILVYEIDRKSGRAEKRSEVSVTPGAGPRHFTIHPNGRFAYLAEEMTSTISAYTVDTGTGALTPIQRISSLPEGFEGHNSCADIHTDPTGKFLYTSNRGHNSLAVHAIDQKTGELAYITNEDVHGVQPRNFLVHPSGQFVFVANRNTDEVVIFKRNTDTGDLIYSGEKVKVPGVVCLKMIRLK